MIDGNFENALIGLIHDLKEGKKSNTQMLCTWDKTRGNDWFTSTESRDQYKGERDVD
jgi:hypothetical protein